MYTIDDLYTAEKMLREKFRIHFYFHFPKNTDYTCDLSHLKIPKKVKLDGSEGEIVHKAKTVYDGHADFSKFYIGGFWTNCDYISIESLIKIMTYLEECRHNGKEIFKYY